MITKYKDLMKNDIDTVDINGNYYSDPLFIWQPIRRCGNDLYFYADVDQYSQLCAIQLLNDIQSDIISKNAIKILDGNCPEAITIHINSCGGYLSSGFALYDFIKNLKVHTIGIVEGMAMSAASLILLACDERHMHENSTILLHQLSTMAIGTYANIRDQMVNIEEAMNRLRKVYITETSIGLSELPKEITDEKDIREHRLMILENLLSHDLELEKSLCIQYGIISPEVEELVELTEEDNEQIQKYIEKVANKRFKENKKEEKEKSSSNSTKKKRK